MRFGVDYDGHPSELYQHGFEPEVDHAKNLLCEGEKISQFLQKSRAANPIWDTWLAELITA